MSYSATVPLAKLYERTSKKGNVYMAGKMGMANIVLFKSDEVSDHGQPIWYLKVSEPMQRSDARDVAKPLDADTQASADRDWQRSDLDDAIPF